MKYEIQNLSRRLVSVHCNSGKTCHLPPGEKHQVPEQEITGNPSVKKLEDRKLIRARKISRASTGKSAAEKTAKAGGNVGKGKQYEEIFAEEIACAEAIPVK